MKLPIDVKVEVTAASGEKYIGAFKIKTRLSIREMLEQDAKRRALLGANPENASSDAAQLSFVVAKINSHLVTHTADGYKLPSWWADNNMGLDLLDVEPVEDLFKKIMDCLAEEEKALKIEAKKIP